ncbi:MAG: hypothetical protein ACOH5I_15055 [Oligoflexus sp.]
MSKFILYLKWVGNNGQASSMPGIKELKFLSSPLLCQKIAVAGESRR